MICACLVIAGYMQIMTTLKVFSGKAVVMGSKISDTDELKRRIENEWADLNHVVTERAVGERSQRSRWRGTFRAYDVKMK